MSPATKKNKLRKAFEAEPRCFVCSLEISTIEECTLEHIIPISLGGSSKQENLAVSHLECNRMKGSTLMRGYEPLEYCRLLSTHLTSMKQSLLEKKAHLRKASEEIDFTKKRVKELYGLYGYMNLMSHPECPDGFDIENFKKVHGLIL